MNNIFKNKCVASLPHARSSNTAAFRGEYAANKVPEMAQISVSGRHCLTCFYMSADY